MNATDTLLEVKGLKKHFPIQGGIFGRPVNHVYAVDGVDFSIKKGQTLGLVGESGCGKSTLGRTVLKLHEPTDGTIKFEDKVITSLSRGAMRPIRRDMQIIFQDPYSSLNPRMSVRDILAEPFRIHKMADRSNLNQEVDKLIDIVGLPRSSLDRYPHEFSGGQRQRIGIARALALRPKLIVADEAVSALDVSIQSQILNLLVELKSQFNLSYLFISHDLAVIEHISDMVAVMYLGKIVELTQAERLYESPRHPYTQALISAIPVPEVQEKRKKKMLLSGDVPSPINPPNGCHFHPRCPKATDKCRISAPELKNISSENDPHWVSCHLVGRDS